MQTLFSKSVTRARAESAQKGSRGARDARLSKALLMPASRRTAFTQRRRTKQNTQSTAVLDDDDVDIGIVQVDEIQSNELMSERCTLECIASDLWATDYEPLFSIEIERNRALNLSYGTSRAGCSRAQHTLTHTSRWCEHHYRAYLSSRCAVMAQKC